MTKNHEISVWMRKPFIQAVRRPVPSVLTGAGMTARIPRMLELMGVRKVFLLISKTVYQSGCLTALFDGLKERGIQSVVFTQVHGDPDYSIVRKALAQYGDCGGIVAIGGGTVIDTAKAVAGCAVSKKTPEKLVGMLRVGHRLPPFIAVPTTAGSGSEATVVAVVTDPETHVKKQILDYRLVPRVAVLDPDLTVELPARITAETSLDALTHALEAYVSGYANEETDRLTRKSIRRIAANLPAVCRGEGDEKAREALLCASFGAGVAFSVTYVGYVHAFAHAVGARYGISHGLACAVLLPPVMEYYLPVCEARFAGLARLLRLSSANDSRTDQAVRFVSYLYQLNRTLGIPKQLEGIPRSDFDEIIRAAFHECHGVYPVPRYYDHDAALLLLDKVCSPK